MPDASPPPVQAAFSRRSLLAAGGAAVAALAGCTTPSAEPAKPAGSAGSAGSAAPTGSAGSAGATAAGSSGATAGSGSGSRQALSAPTDIATGLRTPWSVAVLPDGGVLVSERDPGTVRRLDGRGGSEVVGTVQGVVAGGEGGLLGIAVDPRTVAATPVLYAYLTAAAENRVVAISLVNGRLGAQRTVLGGIPKGSIHNGGRLAFGPDGFLYVTTGETGSTGLAQRTGSLGGKILRITTDGQPAPGNPFPGSPVWSFGHRNVQGIAWDPSGRMWASEFGQSTWDELNVIRPGANYGWPTVEGEAERDGFVDPVREWSTSDASPSGIAIGPDGAVLLAGLRGESLWKVPVRPDGTTDEPQRLVEGEFGRLRDVLVGPDGNVWVVTSNTSRGTPRDGDDRIVRLPQSLTG
jgi:glucose/arabinose dehydrogenase